jgi:hypothetical protein
MQKEKAMQIDDDDCEPCHCGDDDYPCDHAARDIDILTGRWSCYRCGEAGWATSEQIDAEIKHQREYAEWEERENRMEWWRGLVWPIVRTFRRTVERFRIWRAGLTFREAEDDEIPF